jgi:dipeptidyl aminopeptidase/acylaminoacyl peptidase
MAKKPELRFQAAGDMARELDGLFGSSTAKPTAPETPPVQTVASTPRARPNGNISKLLLFGALGAAVIAVVAIVAVLAVRNDVNDDGVDQLTPEAAYDSTEVISHVNPGVQDRIIFTRNVMDSADFERATSKILTLDPQSGFEQLIVKYGQWIHDLAFSETSRHLAFHTNQCSLDLPPLCSDAQDGIRIGETNGGAQGVSYEDLLVLVDGKNPSWSPDGNNIAFQSNREGDFNIYTMTKEGAEQTQITYGNLDDLAPTWSPDGRHIVFKRLDTVGVDLYIISSSIHGSWLDDLTLTRLTQHEEADWSPSWSPDGNNLAFVSGRNGNGDIYTMRRDGSALFRLTTNETDDYAPSWSPSGDKIAFLSSIRGYSDIFIMDNDGANQTRLTATKNIMESGFIWAGR